MRKATDKEINDFIKYRSNHVALVQRIGRVVFDEDFSDHDHDKIEADGETLNLYALRNAMINGTYQAHGDDKKALATIEMVESVANDLKTKYYDKDEIDELISSLTSTP